MPKNHFSAKRIKQPRISDVADVIRATVAPREGSLASRMQERARCLLSKPHYTIASKFAAITPPPPSPCCCRRLRIATLVNRQKPPVDMPCVLSMRTPNSHTSQVSGGILTDCGPYFLASPLVAAARTIHVDIVIFLLRENAESSLLKRENLLSSVVH